MITLSLSMVAKAVATATVALIACIALAATADDGVAHAKPGAVIASQQGLFLIF